ncbi:MAG: deoxyhypusine synthase family protein [Candidatus Hodarchaeota archaeon]
MTKKNPDIPRRRLGEGEGFEALEPIDITKTTTISELIQAMARTSFGGRRIGEAADVLVEMIQDQDCFRVLTLAGAMTVAKQSLVICEMIERGWIHAIVSTGALICHGVIEGQGMKHFKQPKPSEWSDEELFLEGYNRVYDTLEPEANFARVEDLVQSFLFKMREDRTDFPMLLSSFEFCNLLGKHLAELDEKGRGILKSAYNHDVPIYIPAFTDSELGLDFLLENLVRVQDRVDQIHEIVPFHDFDFLIHPIRDLWDYMRRALASKKLGIITIGGGVPRNWAQQVGPMTEILTNRTKWHFGTKKFAYGVRICPEPDHWGGLSGCTYKEGISWGKFEPDAKTAEVLTDATIALPLLVRAVMERLE